MKRIFSTLLVVVLCLCGCTNTIPEDNLTTAATTAITSPTASTTETVPVKQAPLYAVSLPVVTEFTTAEDGSYIFSHIYQNISLTLPEGEVADRIIVDFLNRTDTTQTALELSEAAKRAYAQKNDGFEPYLCSTTYEPMRLDSGVLSLLGAISVFSGGMHSESITASVTYDLLNGTPLSCSAILQETVNTDDLVSLINDALIPQADCLYEDYLSLVEDKFSHGIDHNTDWYLSQTGLCFFFSPYEIGPFASGTISATIPYDKLTGILRDSYFPAERDISSGDINIIPYTEADLSDFTQFTEVTTAAGTKKFLLYTGGMIQDVSIRQNNFGHPYASFVHPCTIFAAYTLTPGDAIVLETDNSVTVSYTSDGERITETFDP